MAPAKRRQKPRGLSPARTAPGPLPGRTAAGAPDRKLRRVLLAALFLATLAVYAPAGRYDFVNYDDPEELTANAGALGGITPRGLWWAITSREAGNWYPVTRLSHLAAVQLFGMWAGGHHLTNAVLHALAAMLLFAFLARATGALWPGALAGFLFALHPLSVEPVAWITGRKDVLCALFWFLGLWAYVRYAERPGPLRYAAVLLAFCCGLMSKSMIVTFPVVLVLLDIWPLRRFGAAALREKVPLFALSAGGAAVAYFTQNAGGAVQPFAILPLELRAQNALISAVAYMAKTIWPAGLAVFYPYPPAYPAWQVAAAALALGAITALAIWRRREHPYLLVGWLWYLVTLGPVLQLVQVGGHARADRYAYVPLAGLFLMLAWGLAGVRRRWPRTATAAAAAVCLALASAAGAQLRHWQNSETLFRHALAVAGRRNYVAHHNLGLHLVEAPGRLEEAIAEFRAAVQISPNFARFHSNLGLALAKDPNRLPEAAAALETAVRLDPDSARLHNNLGAVFAKIPGRMPEAIAELREALRIDPGFADARENLALAMPAPESIGAIQAALRAQPGSAPLHNSLGVALAKTPGRLEAAVGEFREALRLDPRLAEAHSNLGMALLSSSGHVSEATAEFAAAVRLNPASAVSHNNLGMALAKTPGRMAEAAAEFEIAARLDPGYADAYYNRGIALSQMPGRTAAAIAALEQGERLRPDPELGELINQLRSKTGRRLRR